MTRTISRVITLLVASRVVLALDPAVSTAAAIELVRGALASPGEGSPPSYSIHAKSPANGTGTVTQAQA